MTLFQVSSTDKDSGHILTGYIVAPAIGAIGFSGSVGLWFLFWKDSLSEIIFLYYFTCYPE